MIEVFIKMILKGIDPNTGEILPKCSAWKHQQVISDIVEYLSYIDKQIIYSNPDKKPYIPLNVTEEYDIKNSSTYKKLRQKKIEFAKENKVSTFCIIHNSSLVQMIAQKPKTLDELKMIKGFGSVNSMKYGGAFLEILNQFLP